LVVPYDVTARSNMATVVQSFYDRGVRIMLFTDVDDALYWLEKVDQ
jgi:SpoU rRNA methylase family enzyme